MVLHCFDNIKARQVFRSPDTGISVCSGLSLWFSPSTNAQDPFLSVAVIAPDSGMPHIRVVLVLNNRVHDNYQTKTTHLCSKV